MRPPIVPLLFVTLLALGLSPSSFAVEADRSRPDWMWPVDNRHHPQRVEMRRSFRIEGAVQRAELRLAAESCNSEVRLGGRPILILDDYGPWLEIDVTEDVRSGDDTIELLCHGSAGPSAVLFELTVTTIDGRQVVIRSDSDWMGRVVPSEHQDWHPVRSFGSVAAPYWDADRTARITPFDNYEQWRQASGAPVGSDPATFLVRPGFEIAKVRDSSEDEGSWVSMAFDATGRLTIACEDKGLLRMTLSQDGSSVDDFQWIDQTLLECRGLLYTNDSLYAQANNSKGLYRLDDADRDGRFEQTTLIREFPGGVGHGRNDLALGPDGAIYAIFGDSVELPSQNVNDHTSPFREARHGERTTEGHLLRYDPQSAQWDLICSGMRNPFGIDFNADGEAFTYDADAEFDMGSPWYRPTRMLHLVTGGDFGWRGRTGSWPPYDADHAGFTLPAGNIGKGSPTAVKSGQRSSFPPYYRQSVFALDWAYGRILACHLVPRGSTYVCRAENFLKGRPLNVTDLDFGPDGSLYLITGGRKTHSSLYRVRWVGDEVATSKLTAQQHDRASFAAERRQIRKQLSAFHRTDSDSTALAQAWSWLGDPDPLLRNAAQTALEHQPIESWSELALDETRPSWLIPALLSLSRSGEDQWVDRILQRLADVSIDSLSAYERSMLLETWDRCLANPVAPDSAAYARTVERISRWYPDESTPMFAPTGAGRSINHQLALLAERLAVPAMVSKTIRLLAMARTQEERMHAVFVLRNCRGDWTPESRRALFETLGELDRETIGGEGMPGFLSQIREELIATLNEPERLALGNLLDPGSASDLSLLDLERPVVKHWTSDDIDSILGPGESEPDPRRGREWFNRVLCGRCHRAGQVGGTIGPDLTSVANRFGRRDLLLSILEPSRVIDEKYRGEQIVTNDGRVIVGRIVMGGDYRSTNLRIATDPLRPGQIIEIDKSDIETHRPAESSPMPAGLLDSLNANEIRDLLAYLEHAAAGDLGE